MQLTKLISLGGLLGFAQGYVYGTTGTSPPLSTGTDPGSSVPSSSVPYGNYTSSYYPTGTGTGTTVSPTDPTGTIGSTGVYDPSGTAKLTYTAPTGVPTEYYYHHKKPKRNAPFFRRYGF